MLPPFCGNPALSGVQYRRERRAVASPIRVSATLGNSSALHSSAGRRVTHHTSLENTFGQCTENVSWC